MLDQVKIVLVNTSHSGNIGSAARAMKVMGLSRLVLVDPACEIDGKAVAMSAGASDIMNNATVVSTLEEAIADCQLVVGSSARPRHLQWPQLDPREAGTKLIAESQSSKVAIIFGRERTGLTNDELQKCHYHVNIPANPEYSSLNLAMAVQTLSYEVRTAWLESQAYQGEKGEEAYPLSEDLELFYRHLENTLYDSGFINQAHPGAVMNKLRRLFNRARPERQELNILRGALTSFEREMKK
ncbi:tRNA (cytosine(32)/uridine(32)-2'-O)-methyltransferase TrmJ [Vibrio sp. SS-MA-C1-2]|uniref:tRNA (cytosine(32)/uridine(32)-2'-O)-methyltransferase TrmJ n=1 Tax=Vibrio sp. SS-MA-C1-2 TaxID=2908646 RepID=UPI001F292720|nr:tRNA (cytosine(32)/uridine(32)-2'-O)-methyltransferase TrmJ [Vibrio sp. SS-MA-C1-2]UJF18972.1 tRNA (cytosine(32)/uridine(32)-2'-O)-methyltransferase TrmJ [Vibrio sp. SS-MA-C1-2]